MKKILLFILSMITVADGFGQLYPTFSYPSSVDLFGLCEISFLLPKTYSNPYDPDTISVYAVFTDPDNSSYTVNAFYYEDYTFQKHNTEYYEIATHNPSRDGWRIRFTPNKVGTWTFRIRAFDANGELNRPFMNVDHTFSCTSVSDADGFISKANSRFLKRDLVRNGQRQFHSFFPIGPNVAWYTCWKDSLNHEVFSKPKGIYGYKNYINLMDGKANYMRIWLNRYQYLSLYGPEYTQLDVNGNPVVYFDNTINQKDSAELDYIIEYAAKHGIAIMPCIFSYGDFSEGTLVPHSADDSTCWHNNPFNTISDTISNFFVNNRSKTITKNLLRYIVSRWGYATNIMCWELWNEVSNMFKMCDDDDGILQHNVLSWHNEMATCLRDNDPYKHCVSTSMGIRTKTNDSSPVNYNYPLYLDLFDTLDIVQQHNYQNIQKAASIEQVSKILFDSITKSHNDSIYPSKPFFMGEFAFGQNDSIPKYKDKDPFGVDLHNSLWSSLFSTAIGPGSFWWWHYLKSRGLFHLYAPLLTFCQNMPILSETFTAYQTGEKVDHKLVFPNNLQTYYMINATEDTIYGWSQDTAFAYQSLRWLTDSVQLIDSLPYYLHFIDSLVYDTNGYVYKLTIDKRPGPSFNNNTISIPITNWPIGSRYKLTWYDSETGLPIPILNDVYMPILINNQGNKAVNINFPHLIRNLKQHKINNKFGDVVFRLVLEYVPQTKFINDATIAPINQTN